MFTNSCTEHIACIVVVQKEIESLHLFAIRPIPGCSFMLLVINLFCSTALTDSLGMVVKTAGGDPSPAASQKSLLMWYFTTSAWYRAK